MVTVNTTTPPVILHAVYRDYTGRLIEANEVTGRALLRIWDDILSGGCWRDLWVDLHRVEVLTPLGESASESQKNAPSCDLTPDGSQHPLAIKPVDPSIGRARYQALADERYCQWQVERNCRGDIEQLCRTADAHARYGAVMRHVDRLGNTRQGTLNFATFDPDAAMLAFDQLIADYTIAMMEYRAGLQGLGNVLMAMALQALVNVGDDASDYYRYFTPGFVEASGKYLTRHQDAVGESRAQHHVALIYGLPSFQWKAAQ